MWVPSTSSKLGLAFTFQTCCVNGLCNATYMKSLEFFKRTFQHGLKAKELLHVWCHLPKLELTISEEGNMENRLTFPQNPCFVTGNSLKVFFGLWYVFLQYRCNIPQLLMNFCQHPTNSNAAHRQ